MNLDMIFPGGKFWVLADSIELVVARLEDGSAAVPLFSDEGLATTYAHDGGLIGKALQAVVGNHDFAALLAEIKALGATYVAVDHSIGTAAHILSIDEAIAQLRHAADAAEDPAPKKTRRKKGE